MKTAAFDDNAGLTPDMLDENGMPDIVIALNTIARQKNLDNKTISKRVNITEMTIGRIRRRESASVNPTYLKKICAGFNLPLRPFLISNLVKSLPPTLREEGIQAMRGYTSAVPLYQMLSQMPVATKICIDYRTWESAKQQERKVSDVVFARSTLRHGKELIPPEAFHEMSEGSFIFRQTGAGMMGGAGQRCIPDGALVLIHPAKEDTLREGDFVLVQFFNPEADEREVPEPAALYRYQPRERDGYRWEEYHALDTRFPVRVRHTGKFNEIPITRSRAILGKASAVIFSQV